MKVYDLDMENQSDNLYWVVRTILYLDDSSIFMMNPLKGHSNIKYISCALILDLKSQLDIYNAAGQDGTSKHTRT